MPRYKVLLFGFTVLLAICCISGSVTWTDSQVRDQDSLFTALVQAQSYEEGKALLETNSGLVDFWFFTGCAEVLGELSTYDFERALLINRILIDAVDLLESEEERKNALGWCLSSQASIYLGHFRREEAVRLYEQALELFETPPEHLPGIAATCSNLGDIHVDRGEYDDALPLYEKSIALYQEMKAPLGEAKAQRDIGDIYVRMGLYTEADTQYGKALILIQKLYSFPNLSESFITLGRKAEAEIYAARGYLNAARYRFEEAVSDIKEASRIYYAIQDSIGLLATINQLADVSLSWGHVEDAIRYYTGVKEDAQNVTDHYPDAYAFFSILLESLAGLGNAYSQQGSYQQAEASYNEALSIAEKYNNEPGRAAICLNLGLLLAERDRYKEAEKNILSALTIFERFGDWRGMIRCYAAFSVVKTAVYDYEQALKFFDKTKEIIEEREIDDPVLTAGLYTNLGSLHFQCGDLAAAGECYAIALEHANRTESPAAVEVYINIANLHLALGSLQEALETCQTASELAARLTYPRATAAVRQCEGSVHLALGNHLEALAHFQDALEISKQIDNPRGMSEAFCAIGLTYHQMGRFADALRYYSSALDVSQSSGYSLRDRAFVYQGIGAVYSSLGDLDKALENYSKALRIFEELEDHRGLGLCYAMIGSIRVNQKKYEIAESYFLSAIQFLEESGHRSDQAFVYMNLGYLYEQLGRRDRALSILQQALQMSEQVGNELLVAMASLHLGDTLLAAGDSASALSYYEVARNKILMMGSPFETARVYTRIGQVYESNNQKQDAQEAYRQAIGFLEDTRGYMQIEELKSLWPRLGLDAYKQLTRLLIRDGEIEQALFYAERLKAKTLIDLMANGWTSFREGTAQILLQEELELFHEICRLEQELHTEWSKPKEQRRHRLLGDIQELIAYKKEQYADLLVEMKLKVPQYAAVRTVDPERLSLAYHAVGGQLSPSEVVVEYLVTNEETIVWVITNEGIQTASRIAISRDKLTEQVRGFRDEIGDQPVRGQEAASYLDALEKGRDLYELLIAPVKEYLQGATHLVIVPSDVLFYLPFGALVNCPGCSKHDLYGGKFLIQDYSISYAPSLASLYWPFQHAGDGTYESILAVGNPTGDLTAAEQEVKEAAGLFPQSTVLLDEKGTEAAVKEALQTHNYDVVHLSTHGLFDTKMPLLSELLFREGGTDDGNLYAGEILGLPLKTNLVVLSACQTALPPELTQETEGLVVGDELQGLSQALFVAGAPSAVLTLWNVNDKSTSQLMQAMYQWLMKGDPKGEALRQAQISLLHNSTYQHPYYWAPFVLYGVWR
jgi:CHAT domain-containing protein/Flp pilus assembly protein TadD